MAQLFYNISLLYFTHFDDLLCETNHRIICNSTCYCIVLVYNGFVNDSDKKEIRVYSGRQLL